MAEEDIHDTEDGNVFDTEDGDVFETEDGDVFDVYVDRSPLVMIWK